MCIVAAWQTALVISVLGFGTLGAGHFGPPPPGQPIAVVVPPWRSGGFAFADAVGLPPLDMRWGGRLIVFAPTDDPLPLSRMGLFVMPASGGIGCLWIDDRNGATG
ncbi:MAG: hypothetical protein CFE34_02460 [Rhodobacteraceae bacterium PARR1]|nr:MAG: hypothetical protein CFE34_02460 [Rhodobacteraceae bacterium PARR1]